MKALLSTLIYVTAIVALVSLFLFISWATAMPGILINGPESIGLPALPSDYPWRIIILLKLVGGVTGWISLFVIFIKRNKERDEISKLWLVGLGAGVLSAITLIFPFHPLSFPPQNQAKSKNQGVRLVDPAFKSKREIKGSDSLIPL